MYIWTKILIASPSIFFFFVNLVLKLDEDVFSSGTGKLGLHSIYTTTATTTLCVRALLTHESLALQCANISLFYFSLPYQQIVTHWIFQFSSLSFDFVHYSFQEHLLLNFFFKNKIFQIGTILYNMMLDGTGRELSISQKQVSWWIQIFIQTSCSLFC